MLLLLLILQLLPQPARKAVADAMRSQYSWQQAQEKLPETWAVSFRMEYRRPTFTLVQTRWAEFEPADERVRSTTLVLSAVSALPATAFESGFDDASLPGGASLGDRIGQPLIVSAAPLAVTPESATASSHLIDDGSRVLSLPPVIGSLATVTPTRRLALLDNVEPPAGPTDPTDGVGGGVGGVGGGVGAPVPEPGGILIPAGALALILSRRRRRQTLDK